MTFKPNSCASAIAATLREPEHGLTRDVLAQTDVLIWWGHAAHDEVEDAVAAALLVTISGTLTLLAGAAFRRYRNPSFVLLTAAFLVALVEGIVISLLVFGLLAGSSLPLIFVAGVQVLVLVLMYAATFSRE